MRFLAIDYGQKRTGLAITDPEARMAFPLRTVRMKTRDSLFAILLPILEAEAVQAIVVGLPLDGEEQETLSTRQVRNFVERLKRRVQIPIYFMDERLSSYNAESNLRATGRKGKALQAVLDQAAAVLILETFLAQTPTQRIQA